MGFESRATVGLPGLSGVSTNITPGTGGVAVHYNGGPVGLPASGAHTKCRARARAIHNDHVTRNGWAYGAYSEIACQHGIRMQMRGNGRRTAANGSNDGNQRFYAIMGLIGGSETPSEAMLDAIAEGAAYYRGLAAQDAGGQVSPHSRFVATECCGDKLRTHVAAGRFGSGSSGGGGGSSSGGGMSTTRSFTSQQAAVNALGYSPALDVDGIWGPLTEAGVKWLQDEIGVDDDGLWGPATEAAYQAHTSPETPPGAPSGARLAVDGDFGPLTVAATQRATGAKPVDGDFGPISKRALQRHVGTAADGIVGPATVKALQRHLNARVKAGLLVDGKWGPATTRALQKALNAGNF